MKICQTNSVIAIIFFALLCCANMIGDDRIQRRSQDASDFVVIWLDLHDGKVRWLVDSLDVNPDTVVENLEAMRKRYEIPELWIVLVFDRDLTIGEAVTVVERINAAGYEIKSMYSADSNEFGQSFFPARYVPVSIGTSMRKNISE